MCTLSTAGGSLASFPWANASVQSLSAEEFVWWYTRPYLTLSVSHALLDIYNQIYKSTS